MLPVPVVRDTEHRAKARAPALWVVGNSALHSSAVILFTVGTPFRPDGPPERALLLPRIQNGSTRDFRLSRLFGSGLLEQPPYGGITLLLYFLHNHVD